MPDILVVLAKKWKLILGFTILAAVVALVVTMLTPKKYLSTATALPANSLVADKARLFNSNIEALYSDFGTPDELDRIEGTAMLDTIFIATVHDLNLVAHYSIKEGGEAFYKAVVKLKKNSKINRSAYGELKIKVWDEDRNKAAEIANTLLQKIQQLHQRLQNESNIAVLEAVTKDYAAKQIQFRQLADSSSKLSGMEAELWQAKKTALLEQMVQYEKMISQYQLAVNTNPQILLTVENARPSVWHDKPMIVATILLCAFGAFVFSFLMALFVESRNN